MKLFLLSLFFTNYVMGVFGQKFIIDSLAINNWSTIKYKPTISNDGNYFFYKINNPLLKTETLTIQSTNSAWKKELHRVATGFFTGNNKQVIFKRNDTLFFLSLGQEQLKYVPNIASYKNPETDDGIWIAYQVKNNNNELTLRNLLTDKEQHFLSVSEYNFDNRGNALIFRTSTTSNGLPTTTLHLFSLKNERLRSIWTGTSSDNSTPLVNYSLDDSGNQLAFIIQKGNDSLLTNTLWYYKTNMDKAIIIADNQSIGIDPGLSISGTAPHFTSNGQYIFFALQPSLIDNRKPKIDAVKVDVWTYRDSILQSKQLLGSIFSPKIEYTSVINIAENKITRLEQEDEVLRVGSETTCDYVIIQDKKSIDRLEYWWKTAKQKSTYLVSLKDGSTKLLNSDSFYISYSFSPGGKYLVYYDPSKASYYSYNLSSGKISNISRGISTQLGMEQDTDSLPGIRRFPVGIAGWLVDDNALLIYDNYDIWELDLMNIAAPVNITNGYGQKRHIKLRLLNEDNNAVYSQEDTLLLVGFNMLNKYNSFYRTSLNKKGDPGLLSMSPHYIYTQNTQIGSLLNIKPLKAAAAQKWILSRQSATDAPNFFLTNDFINYHRLTDIQPQKSYNWLTTELLTWKQLDGTPCQGILYKPENFDPHKKYPIIFNYYEKMSQQLYIFIHPIFTKNTINIPWFVSRGYLVFTPDIHYTLGKPGESAYNSVVSAARYLSKFPWVDSSKMGINGHSFGGYETNYLVTHTHIFAAAVSSAGPSELISEYGGLTALGNNSSQTRYENGQFRLGHNLWERPDLYIANSPIFNVDQVTTPLLIMHNKADPLVPWLQSVEFFTGLRRLGKKTWMLQYDEGTHGLTGKDAVDYTIRVTQFFDHYLKGSLPPKWMTKGIPARLKGIETGYELDTSGQSP